MPEESGLHELVGRRVRLPGRFVEDVTVEAVRALGPGADLRVRGPRGEFDEAVLPSLDLEPLLIGTLPASPDLLLADPESLRLVVESARPVEVL